MEAVASKWSEAEGIFFLNILIKGVCWRSEGVACQDNFLELVLSINHVVPEDQTLVCQAWLEEPLPSEYLTS